jgi:hypothetical protein
LEHQTHNPAVSIVASDHPRGSSYQAGLAVTDVSICRLLVRALALPNRDALCAVAVAADGRPQSGLICMSGCVLAGDHPWW